MSKINGYGINQSSLYANASKNKSAKETKEKKKTKLISLRRKIPLYS